MRGFYKALATIVSHILFHVTDMRILPAGNIYSNYVLRDWGNDHKVVPWTVWIM